MTGGVRATGGAGPRLSICIPTYNRGEFLGATLESIAQAGDTRIEVVVSDNASQDQTAEVVAGFRDRLPRLVYSRSERNVGYAANFYRAVDLASGDYAWLLGSDDVVCPGMLARSLAELESGATLYIFDRLETGVQLDPWRVDPVLSGNAQERRFVPGRMDSLLTYLDRARSITALFSFISSIIFKRSAWQGVAPRPEWLGCTFPHAIRMWGMFGDGGALQYVDAPLVMARMENDSFNPGDGNAVRRLLVNLHGFQMVRDEYWSRNRALREAVNRVIRRTHPHLDLLKLRRLVTVEEIGEVCRCLDDYGYGSVFTRLYRTAWCCHLMILLKAINGRFRRAPARLGP